MAVIRYEAEGLAGQRPSQTDVARVWLGKNELMFQWLEGTSGVPAVPLGTPATVRLGGNTHAMALGRPQTERPLAVDMDHGTSKTSLPMEWLPETDTLRLQILKLDGDFPEYTFDPGDVIRPGERNRDHDPADRRKGCRKSHSGSAGTSADA